MGQTCAKLGLEDCFTKPLRFLGVQRPTRHRFQRLRDGHFGPPADLGDVFVVDGKGMMNTSFNYEAAPSGGLFFHKNMEDLHEYVSFPFLTDKELGEWIVQTRFMIILRGPPGSGKSYIASCIKKRYPTAEIISSDDFWCRESASGEYRFDESRLEEAHEDCRTRVEEAARRGASPLVIDSTKIRAYEVRVYTGIARLHDYTPILVSPHTPWRFDVNELASRNVHRVPLGEVRWMVRQFEPVYPLYYGWFWAGDISCNPVASRGRAGRDSPRKATENLINDAFADFQSILGVPTAKARLALECGLDPTISSDNLVAFWSSAVLPHFGAPTNDCTVKPGRPHITAMFAANGKADGTMEYAEKKAVEDALMGALQTVYVCGLFVTRRTIGLGIRLEGNEELDLWDSDDNADVGPDSLSSQRPKGCRAHVTLALAPGVSALETGLDALRIFDVEASGRPDASQIALPQGILREIVLPSSSSNSSPEHVFYYMFRKPTPERVLFAGYY